MKRETIKITKTMATSLAKYLLGKVEFIEKDFCHCYVFRAGKVMLQVYDQSSGYSYSSHSYFSNDEEGNPYNKPCYSVYWNIPGVSYTKHTYYKMNETYDEIYFSYKDDDEN